MDFSGVVPEKKSKGTCSSFVGVAATPLKSPPKLLLCEVSYRVLDMHVKFEAIHSLSDPV